MADQLKVLMLNGSPRPNGNIALAFRESVFRKKRIVSGQIFTMHE